jgi:hypothetical protein
MERVELFSPPTVNFREGAPYNHKKNPKCLIASITEPKKGLSCCLSANVTTWNTKVPILNTWAFVGDKEKLRQKAVIPSLVPPTCAQKSRRHGPIIWTVWHLGQESKWASPWLRPAAIGT